tara:strand:- start:260 stop:793 length:534 start_codon:yes stop_codon:yes gene_type:complete
MRTGYDADSPFTGNRSVMSEPDPSKEDILKLCMDTGYHTYELNWKTGSDVLTLVEETLPQQIVDSKREVNDGNTWYKMMLVTPFVMLIPETIDDVDKWIIYTLKEGDPTKDEIVMTVPNVDGDPLYRTIDVQTRQVFDADKYSDAMNAFQVIGAAVYGKIHDMVMGETTDSGGANEI